MKHVVIISQWPTPWGIGIKKGVPQRYGLIKRLSKEGFKVSLVALSIKKDGFTEYQARFYNQYYFRVPGFKFGVNKFKEMKGNFWYFIKKLFSAWDLIGFTACALAKSINISKKNPPVLVISYGEIGALSALILAKLYNVPNITRGYGLNIYYTLKKFENESICLLKRIYYIEWSIFFALKIKATRIITSDDDSKEDLAGNLMKIASPLVFIPNGVDRNYFIPKNEIFIKRIKEIYQLQKFDIVLGNVGRWAPYKGIERILMALKVLQKKSGLNIGILLVGAGQWKNNLWPLVKKLELEDKVIITEQVTRDDIPSFYYCIDIYMSVFKRANKCFALLEALVSGRPVITSGELRENKFIKNGKTVIMVEETDNIKIMAERIAKEIHSLIVDPNKRAILGNNAENFAKKYIWEVNDQIEYEFSILKKVLNERRNN